MHINAILPAATQDRGAGLVEREVRGFLIDLMSEVGMRVAETLEKRAKIVKAETAGLQLQSG